jgi:hypothetical protein
MARVFQVQAFFDEEAQVCVATSDDLVGLVVEAETLDSLIKKIQEIVPDLAEGNGFDVQPDDKMRLVTTSPVELHAA